MLVMTELKSTTQNTQSCTNLEKVFHLPSGQWRLNTRDNKGLTEGTAVPHSFKMITAWPSNHKTQAQYCACVCVCVSTGI